MSERRSFVPESVVRGGVVGAIASQSIDLPASVPERRPIPERRQITSSDQLTIFDAGKERRARAERGGS